MNGFVMEVCNERDYTKTKSTIERKNENLFYKRRLERFIKFLTYKQKKSQKYELSFEVNINEELKLQLRSVDLLLKDRVQTGYKIFLTCSYKTLIRTKDVKLKKSKKKQKFWQTLQAIFCHWDLIKKMLLDCMNRKTTGWVCLAVAEFCALNVVVNFTSKSAVMNYSSIVA